MTSRPFHVPLFVSMVCLTVLTCSGEPRVEQLKGLLTAVDGRSPPVAVIPCVDGVERRVLLDSDQHYGFSLDHLFDHLEERLPVTIEAEHTRDGRLVARTIADAIAPIIGC